MDRSDWPTVGVEFGADAVVGPGAALGLVREAALTERARVLVPVTFGDRVIVGSYVTVHDSTDFGDDCFIDDYTRVGYGCSFGDRVRLEYGATISDRVKVGDGSIVAGFVGDATVIGKDCVVMGQLVHSLTSPWTSTWGIEEAAPVIGDFVVVGMGSVVVGGVTIGSRSYVAAGATVTHDVASECIVTGVNVTIPLREWRGRHLAT